MPRLAAALNNSYQYGEQIHVQKARPEGGDLEFRLVDERYVGHRSRAGAVNTMSAEGVSFGMGIARRVSERRWSPEGPNELPGLPCVSKAGPRKAVEGEKPVRFAPLEDSVPAHARSVQLEGWVPLAHLRSRYITEADGEKYGCTGYCPGCVSVTVRRSSRVSRNNVCRHRVASLVAQDDVGRARLAIHASGRPWAQRRQRRAAPRGLPGGPSVAVGVPLAQSFCPSCAQARGRWRS